MDSFAEKIDRVDSAAARIDVLFGTLKKAEFVADGSDTRLKRAVNDVLTSITKEGAAFQSIQAHHGELEERVAGEKTRLKEQQRALAVEAESLGQKSEYLQKWQEKLEMQEKVLNSTASRLQKRETDVAERETRLRDKEIRFKNIHREALKLLTDAKARAKVVTNDIEAFEAEIVGLDSINIPVARDSAVGSQPQAQAPSGKRTCMPSSRDSSPENPPGSKRRRRVLSRGSSTSPVSPRNQSLETGHRPASIGQDRTSWLSYVRLPPVQPCQEGQIRPNTQDQELANRQQPAGLSGRKSPIALEIRDIWAQLIISGDVDSTDCQRLAGLMKSTLKREAVSQQPEAILVRGATSTETGKELCLTSLLRHYNAQDFLVDADVDSPKLDYAVACGRCHPNRPCFRVSWAGNLAKTDKSLPTRWIVEKRAARPAA
ncbi:MAG: hypothetical protein Q9225_007383 [Loekoesia sp. 1 TL-2023]